MSCCQISNVVDREILVFDNRVLSTTFKMRFMQDYMFEIHRKGDGCKCFGPCDKDCSLITTYPVLSQDWVKNNAEVKVQWDDTLWNLKPGYYRLKIIAGGCPCKEVDIKIGKRCGFSSYTHTKKQPAKCSEGKDSARTQSMGCDPCPPAEPFKPDPCDPWPWRTKEEKKSC